jgi:hypothetical protein
MDQDAPDCGVIFIAAGKFHTDAAVAAARSVRGTNPWLAIDLFTDQPDAAKMETGEPFDRIVQIGDGHRRSKVDYLPKTRFPRTLYLDSDTRVVADLSSMFELLERFDLAIAHAHARNGGRQTKFWRREVPEAFPQHNGGVILYRGEGKALAFMEAWRDAYYEAGFKWDQTTLRELMWISDLAIYVLPPEYNVRYRKYLEVWEPREAVAKILHMAEFYDELERAPGAFSRHESGLARLVQRVRRRLNL